MNDGLVPKRDYGKYENEQALMLLQGFAERAVEVMDDLRSAFIDLGKVCGAIDVDQAMVKAHAAQQEKLRLKAIADSHGASSGDGAPTRLDECSYCQMVFGHKPGCINFVRNRRGG